MGCHHSNGGKSFLLGTVIGGVLAGAAALLLAPKTGKKMRKELNDKCCEVTDHAKEMCDDVYDQAKDLVDKARCLAEDAKDIAASLMKRK